MTRDKGEIARAHIAMADYLAGQGLHREADRVRRDGRCWLAGDRLPDRLARIPPWAAMPAALGTGVATAAILFVVALAVALAVLR